jgi:hypothetical protein
LAVQCIQPGSSFRRFSWFQLLEEGAMKTTVALAACAVAASYLMWQPQAQAQQKTVKQCRTEWVASRDSTRAAGKTQREFIAECRGVSPTMAVALPAEGQFASESQAKADCDADAVVWVNPRSGIYHPSGSRSYGSTKGGAYMCEKASVAAGFRAAKALRPDAT